MVAQSVQCKICNSELSRAKAMKTWWQSDKFWWCDTCVETICPPKSRTRDSIGEIPKITTPEFGFVEILRLTHDKRGHVLFADHCAWLELKLKVIGVIADRGLATVKPIVD